LKKILIVLNLFAAIVVAVCIDVLFPGALTNAEQYFLGLLVFVALSLAELLYTANDISTRLDSAVAARRVEAREWEARTALERKLQEVRRLFNRLDAETERPVDLFYEYHKKKLAELERSLRDACVKQEAQIDETMFSVTNWLLESSFQGQEDDILRAVLATRDLDFFFDVHTRMYFSQMWELVQAGKSKGVRRLIVVDQQSHLEDERLKRLVTWHNKVANYECRMLNRINFSRIITDYRLQHLVVDFGIYGDTYLYKGLTNSETQIVGIYSKDPAEIAQFANCFQSCWDAARDLHFADTEAGATSPTVDWVFDGPPPAGP
jgi:hypothetical protein